jgi:hypothetical protein
MKTSESIANISKAFIECQKELPTIEKTEVNPFFHSKYAGLDMVIAKTIPVLAKHKLAILQFPIEEDGLETIVLHESGEYLSERFIMKPVSGKPQDKGSAISYARRYAWCSILGIATEDDDGNNASKEVKKKEPMKANNPKVEIVNLLKKLECDTSSKEQCELSVKSLTDLELKEANYPEIVNRLLAILENK